MSSTRRELLLAALGLFIAGCADESLVDDNSYRPRSAGPADPARTYYPPSGPSTYQYPSTQYPPSPEPIAPHNTPRPSPSTPDTVRAGALQVIPRSAWTSAGPIMSRIVPMDGINRITCHHEGWTPVWFADVASTRERLESIRQYHIIRKPTPFGDIGYHFIIDRAGRLWEGRSLKYQGAHVHGENPRTGEPNNAHNIGVMSLGNFDLQSPTSAQLVTLRHTVSTLMRQYRVPLAHVFTHQELNETKCPGVNLQPRISYMRSSGELA